MRIKSLMIGAILALGITSCSTPKDITYIQDVNEGTHINVPNYLDIKVQPEDKISIIVSSKDAQLASLFNLVQTNNRIGHSTTSNTSTNGNTLAYTVSKYGNITFPVLGEIHVAGMRREEVADYIQKELISRNLVKDAIVTVEFTNTGVTVLGEVGKPGKVYIDRDHMTILEAIAQAGDLTISGMRKNVLVQREENGAPTFYRIDLTDANSVYSSPAYYLQQNDVIYVEPNDMKKRTTVVNGNNSLSPSFWISIASFVTTLMVLIF